MSRPVQVTVNGAPFPAAPGARLLDAALAAGAEIPYDCRSGRCGTCRVRVLDGHVLGGRCAGRGGVLACQAVLLSDAQIAVEHAPPVCDTDGVVERIEVLARDVVEVTIATAAPLAWYAGQYVNVAFAGFPARSFSPTVALDGSDRPGTFRLHVKRLEQGAVSPAIGGEIVAGHPVAVEGPFGAAWHRPGSSARLVLFSGGTGFAPIWAIADAALCESFERQIVVVAGVRSIYSLYMAPALERLSRCPNVTVVPLTAEPQSIAPVVATGSPADLGSVIRPGDVVHAAGSPAMVEAIAAAADAAGVEFHADPFHASGRGEDASLLRSLAERFGIGGARAVEAAAISSASASIGAR